MNHDLKLIKGTRIECSCNWFVEDVEWMNIPYRARIDKMIDVHREHIAYERSFHCIECGGDRRGHPKTHKWRIE